MELVLSREGEERLLQGLQLSRWQYRTVRMLRVTATKVVAVVQPLSERARAPSAGPGEELLEVEDVPEADAAPRPLYVAKRVNESDVEVAAAEARLWSCAQESDPRLFLRLVEFVPLSETSFIYIREYCAAGKAAAELPEPKVVRLLAFALCAVRALRRLGIPTRGRLRTSELFAHGKLRGFGPAVVQRATEGTVAAADGQASGDEDRRRSSEVPGQAEADDVYDLGCLLRDLMGHRREQYSKRLRRLEESCLRDDAELRPDLITIERKLCRLIHRSRAKTNAATEDGAERDAPPSPELSNVQEAAATAATTMTAARTDAERLEEVIDSAELLDGVAAQRSADREAGALLTPDPPAPTPVRLPTHQRRGSHSGPLVPDDAAPKTPPVAAPRRSPGGRAASSGDVEQATRAAIGDEQPEPPAPRYLEFLLGALYDASAAEVADTIFKTIRRKTLQLYLHPVASLKALLLVHGLLLRGPRAVYSAAVRYLDMLKLLRHSLLGEGHGGGTLSVDARGRSASFPQRMRQALTRIVGGAAVPAAGRLTAPDAPAALLDGHLSDYASIVIRKVRRFQDFERDAGTVALPLGRSRRLTFAVSLAESIGRCLRVVQQCHVDRMHPPLASLMHTVMDELYAELVVSVVVMASTLAPALSSAERRELAPLFRHALADARALWQWITRYDAERMETPVGAALRKLAACSLTAVSGPIDVQRAGDATDWMQLVAQRFANERAVGCGLRSVETVEDLPRTLLYRFHPEAVMTPTAHRSPRVEDLASARRRSHSIGNTADMLGRPPSPGAKPRPLPSRLALPYHEMAAADLELQEEIGRGSFGAVHKARLRSTGAAVAVKLMDVGRGGEDAHAVREFYSEVSILCRLHHENVLSFHGAGRTPDHRRLFIVTEYMARGTLFDVVHRRRELLSPLRKKAVALDVCRGMAYLHAKGLLHRDLKSANLLVDEAFRVKVGDFGLARRVGTLAVAVPLTGQCGTFQYMAPEVLACAPYNKSADVYSFGVLLWELLEEQLPYAGLQPAQVVVAVMQQHVRPELDPNWSPELQALLRECWHPDAARRPTFAALVERLPPIPFPAPTGS